LISTSEEQAALNSSCNEAILAGLPLQKQAFNTHKTAAMEATGSRQHLLLLRKQICVDQRLTDAAGRSEMYTRAYTRPGKPGIVCATAELADASRGV